FLGPRVIDGPVAFVVMARANITGSTERRSQTTEDRRSHVCGVGQLNSRRSNPVTSTSRCEVVTSAWPQPKPLTDHVPAATKSNRCGAVITVGMLTSPTTPHGPNR